jgi:hypothetical protein
MMILYHFLVKCGIKNGYQICPTSHRSRVIVLVSHVIVLVSCVIVLVYRVIMSPLRTKEGILF